MNTEEMKAACLMAGLAMKKKEHSFSWDQVVANTPDGDFVYSFIDPALPGYVAALLMDKLRPAGQPAMTNEERIRVAMSSLANNQL